MDKKLKISSNYKLLQHINILDKEKYNSQITAGRLRFSI